MPETNPLAKRPMLRLSPGASTPATPSHPICDPAHWNPLQELGHLARAFSVNVLIEGPLSSGQQIYVLELIGFDRFTDLCYAQGAHLTLPEKPDRPVVLEDVTTLSNDDQARLWRCIRNHNPRIVSFASTPLFPLVHNGRFLDGLFYTLNTISVTLDPRDVPETR